ncbi:MAG: shikimate dehydrogenase [Cyclobacteriaceae bacterium]|nr:shikimate dehydrogenase [Cyclobacteriaceae bacterium SS2]
MRNFGLIGYPLGHSFSKKYFTEKFKDLGLSDHKYGLFELETIDLFPELWKDPDLVGINVTVPHKQAVRQYLDALDPSAEKVGAVNVIKRTGNRLTGYNSDYFGFRTSLENFMPKNSVRKALILGTGGSSKAVKAVLTDLNIQFVFVSRKSGEGMISYDQMTPEIIKEHQLIVNTTPLGMHPKVDNCPAIPYEALGSVHLLFDLVYNPETTKFMQMGLDQGARVKNGLEMLHLQADKSWEIWNS